MASEDKLNLRKLRLRENMNGILLHGLPVRHPVDKVRTSQHSNSFQHHMVDLPYSVFKMELSSQCKIRGSLYNHVT